MFASRGDSARHEYVSNYSPILMIEYAGAAESRRHALK